MKINQVAIYLVFVALVIVTEASANPISEINRSQAEADLKNYLLKKYGDSYSTIEMLLDAGMESYDKLASLPENEVNNNIINNLKNRYYPSFSTILMLYQSNKESYDRLNK
jgi:hypothetical protein